ncbi:hypothetical protein ACQW02_11750 [Humitalea sp. 24SJ18S-53]|uniref:hypothetical protein n=1 Tax=Humitalea sp. 24SJ18S-53 TaxID=3422307 RepID=UPI003D67C554
MSMTRYSSQPSSPNEAPVLTGADADRPIQDTVNNKMNAAAFHLARNPKLFPLLRRGKVVGSGQEPLDDLFKQVLATALLETANSDPGALEPPGAPTRAQMLGMKISTFNWKTKAAQLGLLNALWAKCYEAVVPDQEASTMWDQDEGFAYGSGQLTSSLRPVNPDVALVGLKKGPVDMAWAKHTIGFRIDGGKAKAGSRDDLPRVMKDGVFPLATNAALALQLTGKNFFGLDVGKGTHIHLGYQNRDAYNESATCCARTMIGATAFPYRWTDTDEEGLDYRYLFAFRCAGLLGLDTEEWQIAKDAAWRPGEKAFLKIAADRIIGYTRVKRHGYGQGWTFSLVDATWTWVGAPPQPVKDYLTAELSAWKPGMIYNVRGVYDFQ